MKILVVSGFLGAGKTTFIKELSRKTRRDFVVMENEYAQADIDRELLNEEKAVNIWELTEGCVCCSMKTDFASSILTIANTLDPEYLVVEPTGAAVLSRIIANIRQIEYERITLLRPITIVDADSFSLCLRDYRELFLDQLKTAGTIVVSRRSFSSEEEIRDFSKTLAEINPDASIQVPHYSQPPHPGGNHFFPAAMTAAEMSRKAHRKHRIWKHSVSMTSLFRVPCSFCGFWRTCPEGLSGKLSGQKALLPSQTPACALICQTAFTVLPALPETEGRTAFLSEQASGEPRFENFLCLAFWTYPPPPAILRGNRFCVCPGSPAENKENIRDKIRLGQADIWNLLRGFSERA